jgi:hypothetical protein
MFDESQGLIIVNEVINIDGFLYLYSKLEP